MMVGHRLDLHVAVRITVWRGWFSARPPELPSEGIQLTRTSSVVAPKAPPRNLPVSVCYACSSFEVAKQTSSLRTVMAERQQKDGRCSP